jgi:hypothetical protein
VRQWHKRLLGNGVRAEYVEYPRVRHNAWDYAYKDAAIFDWFKQYERVRHPQRVRFTALDYAHSSAYWVRLDALTPGTPATIDAVFTARNTLTVTTKNLDAFTLMLQGHPMTVLRQPVLLTIDDQKLRLKLPGAISFARTQKGWALQRAVPAPGRKGPGAEGPIVDALSSKHIYVYGTADSPPPDDIERRRMQAMYASDWSTPQARLMLTFRVMADAEVKEEDLKTANLVLFGTRETNSIIARLSSRLPLALNPGAADYSLTYVYPVDGRYVVISSGLPWWTRADQALRPGMPFITPVYRTLQSFGDFILFRGGLENVITEGRFNNDWKLPAEAAERIRATGAVEVRSQQ